MTAIRSVDFRSRYVTMDSVLARRLAWLTRTALGRDVVPEVNIRAASACGSVGTSGHSPIPGSPRVESVTTGSPANAVARRRCDRRSIRTAVQPTHSAWEVRSATVFLSENGTTTPDFIAAR